MLIPVLVTRVDGVGQWGGGTGPGRRAECTHCGRCRVVADDARTPARAANYAVSELARTCEGQGVHHYYRSKLPAGVRLLYRFGGEWKPANWLGGRVCNAAGEVGGAVPVAVAAAVMATPRATAKAARDAARLAARIRRHWTDVRVDLPATPEEATA